MMNPSTARALKFLRRALVVAGLGAAGVTLWPSTGLDPATAAEKRAVLAKLRCNGDDCYALLRVSGAPTVARVLGTNGGEPAFPAACPGDVSFSLPAVPVVDRTRLLLDCAVRDGALTTYHASYGPVMSTACVLLRMDRGMARAWASRVDPALSPSLVDVRPSRGDVCSGRVVWAGASVDDETDDAQDGGIPLDDPADGGAP